MTKIDEEVLEDHTQRVFKVRRHGVSTILEPLDKFTFSGAGVDLGVSDKRFHTYTNTVVIVKEINVLEL